jgi:putative transcriptional regulator
MGLGIGVTQGNVSNYERGQTMPPDVAARLIAYAKTLGHSITHNDIYASEVPP